MGNTLSNVQFHGSKGITLKHPIYISHTIPYYLNVDKPRHLCWSVPDQSLAEVNSPEFIITRQVDYVICKQIPTTNPT